MTWFGGSCDSSLISAMTSEVSKGLLFHLCVLGTGRVVGK